MLLSETTNALALLIRILLQLIFCAVDVGLGLVTCFLITSTLDNKFTLYNIKKKDTEMLQL